MTSFSPFDPRTSDSLRSLLLPQSGGQRAGICYLGEEAVALAQASRAFGADV